jgi:hypothetical protein
MRFIFTTCDIFEWPFKIFTMRGTILTLGMREWEKAITEVVRRANLKAKI